MRSFMALEVFRDFAVLNDIPFFPQPNKRAACKPICALKV
jgi:hypothetical protein